MAEENKLYGTKEQHKELHDWMSTHAPKLLKHLYNPTNQKTNADNKYIIANFPNHIEYIIMRDCPLQFVQDKLAENHPKEVIEKAKEGYYVRTVTINIAEGAHERNITQLFNTIRDCIINEGSMHTDGKYMNGKIETSIAKGERIQPYNYKDKIKMQ